MFFDEHLNEWLALDNIHLFVKFNKYNCLQLFADTRNMIHVVLGKYNSGSARALHLTNRFRYVASELFTYWLLSQCSK